MEDKIVEGKKTDFFNFSYDLLELEKKHGKNFPISPGFHHLKDVSYCPLSLFFLPGIRPLATFVAQNCRKSRNPVFPKCCSILFALRENSVL